MRILLLSGLILGALSSVACGGDSEPAKSADDAAGSQRAAEHAEDKADEAAEKADKAADRAADKAEEAK